jgi:glycosyltransferase involved in cell wall biosynthesis
MREIVVNGRFLSRRVTGVERYGREMLSCIGIRCRVEQTHRNGTTGHIWEQLVLPAKLSNKSILWSPANTGPLLVRNQALTIHDLSPLEHPEYFDSRFSTWYRFILPILARRARVVFVPSCYIQRKVMKRFGLRNVTVTPNAVNTACFFPGAQQDFHKLPERFILFIGSLQPRKNLQALLNAWEEVKDAHQNLWLLIGGDRGAIFRSMNLPARERVHYLGYIAEKDLPGLYAKAALFVLPSLDEGFGLPALEAMACGTPVIVSDRGALPEVVGEAALIFQSSDPGSLASSIQMCLDQDDLAASLIAKGYERIGHFSWQASAELVWKTLSQLLSTKSG